MSDKWEVDNALDPTFDDSDGDEDGDGWTNYEEYLNGTNPKDSDPSGPDPTPPDIIEVIPHDGAGITDDTRVLMTHPLLLIL